MSRYRFLTTCVLALATTLAVLSCTPDPSGEGQNLALIRSNETRNTDFDGNQFRDVPMGDIELEDLTVSGDPYSEPFIRGGGFFRVKCEFSHFAFDDPIVHPGEPGRAHLHMFFGNTDANAYSTFESLRDSGTGTCNGEDLNRTAYWVPALLDSEGNALIPGEIMVYYKNDAVEFGSRVNPFPDDLRMVTGNAQATSPQNDIAGISSGPQAVSFSCGTAYSNVQLQSTIPDCSGFGNRQALEMKLWFQQCADTTSPYQSDQSHVSFRVDGAYGSQCPASHSTNMSTITYRIFYFTKDYDGSITDVHLSSDVKMDQILPGGTTAHGDWFGAWHPEAMQLWVDNCNNSFEVDCEIGLLQRTPDLSIVPRQRWDFPYGYKAPAEELVKLCPGRQFDPSEPLRSVAMCRMN